MKTIEEIVADWETQMNQLAGSLQNLEREKKDVGKHIKESELGQRQTTLTRDIREVKKLMELKRFEISGVRKALAAVRKEESTGRVSKVSKVG